MDWFLFIAFFSFMVALKGGLIGHVFKQFGKEEKWKAFKEQNIVTNFVLDGSFLSAVASGFFIGAHTGWLVGLLFAIAWFTGWAMSIGEEVGAIGRLKLNWGPYVKWLGASEAREFGWKKGLHRGTFLGACLSLAMYSIAHNEIIILVAALFPATYFLGNEIYYRIHKSDSWFYAEFIFGAIIGAAMKGIL